MSNVLSVLCLFGGRAERASDVLGRGQFVISSVIGGENCCYEFVGISTQECLSKLSLRLLNIWRGGREVSMFPLAVSSLFSIELLGTS